MKNASKSRRMPVWAMIITDTILMAAAVGVFMLFDYVMPHSGNTNGTVVAQVDSQAENTFELPSASKNSDTDSSSDDSETSSQDSSSVATSQPTVTTTAPQTEKKPKRTTANWYDNTGTDQYESDQNAISSITNASVTSEQIDSYTEDDAEITIYKKSVGEGSEKITYYVADVYVTNAGVIKTAFANDTYGKNIKSNVSQMARTHDAIWAINGDFYGNTEEGIVIRNGVKYRDNLNDADVCVLFTDGTVKTYSADEFNADTVIALGAWQAWCFGPQLLDGSGNVLSSFNTTTYLNSSNPRSAIGYCEPGHYIFVTVDGRNEGYSKGATLSELAAIMSDEGCKYAYNLDGGKSAMMYFDGEVINQPDGGGRDISDIMYIGG